MDQAESQILVTPTRQVTLWEIYGEKLLMDLHGCYPGRFTRRGIEQFCKELCELIEMERCVLHLQFL